MYCRQARADGSRARRRRAGVRGQAGGGCGGAAAAPAAGRAIRAAALPAGSAATAPTRLWICRIIIQVSFSSDISPTLYLALAKPVLDMQNRPKSKLISDY